ncbi:MAG: YdcF family protein [Candidatus Thiodiazotropha sp.]|jgi:uncharacterized SAM-binding protein YcdF (DUF218 family)
MDGINTQFISMLILPPAGPILLGLLGLLFWSRKFGRKLLITAFLLQVILSLPITAGWIFTNLQYQTPLTLQQQQTAEAIVVLGSGRYNNAPEYGSDTASLRMLSRLRYAAKLARETGLPIIPSGGHPDGMGESEAEIAERILQQEYGVPILKIEKLSNNTWENARNVAQLMKTLKIEQVILVTDAAHMPRALYSFEQHGVTPIPGPINFEYQNESKRPFYERIIPSRTAANNISLGLHEYLGLLWYSLK